MATASQDYEAALQQAETSEAKLLALNNLSSNLCEVDPKRALSLANEAHDLARTLNDIEGGIAALLNRAWAQFNLADYGSSIGTVQNGLAEARSAKLDKQEFDALIILGNNYNVIGSHADALQCYTDTLTISKKMNARSRLLTTVNLN